MTKFKILFSTSQNFFYKQSIGLSEKDLSPLSKRSWIQFRDSYIWSPKKHGHGHGHLTRHGYGHGDTQNS